jgi:citrate lyase subunit beta/citryl-CoA lyase
MTPAPLRTVLFLPASSERAIAKARTLAVDVVVLDLEDAVAPERKAEARERVAPAVAAGFGDSLAAVRVNGLDTEWGEQDLAVAAGAGADVVIAPKVGSAEEVRHYGSALAAAAPETALWVMIETARGVLNLREIAGSATSTRLAALVAGTNDLAKDLRARPDPERTVLSPHLAQVVAAARAYGLAAIDGVWNALDDVEGLARQAAQGRALGFDGKSLIHPDQIAPVRAAFAPTEAERAWAEATVRAFDDPAAAGRGAVRTPFGMVERLHLEEARRILAG